MRVFSKTERFYNKNKKGKKYEYRRIIASIHAVRSGGAGYRGIFRRIFARNAHKDHFDVVRQRIERQRFIEVFAMQPKHGFPSTSYLKRSQDRNVLPKGQGDILQCGELVHHRGFIFGGQSDGRPLPQSFGASVHAGKEGCVCIKTAYLFLFFNTFSANFLAYLYPSTSSKSYKRNATTKTAFKIAYSPISLKLFKKVIFSTFTTNKPVTL